MWLCVYVYIYIYIYIYIERERDISSPKAKRNEPNRLPSWNPGLGERPPRPRPGQEVVILLFGIMPNPPTNIEDF